MLYGISGDTGVRPWKVKINETEFLNILRRYLFGDRRFSCLKSGGGIRGMTVELNIDTVTCVERRNGVPYARSCRACT
jgi:hypothetical protein